VARKILFGVDSRINNEELIDIDAVLRKISKQFVN